MENFELAVPGTISEAVALLPKEWDDGSGRSAAVLAGGQDLLTVLKEGLESPEMLVHLREVKGLGGIGVGDGGSLRLGAMSRISELASSEIAGSSWSALVEAAVSVGSPQIRNQATVGGNLCQRPRCWYFRNSDAPCLKKGGY